MTQFFDFTENAWKPIKLCQCRSPIIPVNDSNEADHELHKVRCMVMFKTRPLKVETLFDQVKQAELRKWIVYHE